MADPVNLMPDRHQFPGLKNKTYFNFGGQGILPTVALEAIMAMYGYLQENGPFSIAANQYIQQLIAQLRQALGETFNVDPNTITITDNVTTGCDIVLWGLDWQRGDEILLTDCEHPGIIAIVQAIAARFGITYRFFPVADTLNQGDAATVLADHLGPKTRLVILSHLLWNTGQVLPLAEIMAVCRRHQGDYPVRVLVDGAQSAGSLPLDFSQLEVDYYAFTGHKWFAGPAGVGGLYIHGDAKGTANAARLGDINPTYVGWRSITYGAKGEPTGWAEGGKRFEVATSAYPQYAGLLAALQLHQRQGTAQERYQAICQRSQLLWQGLNQLPHIHCLATSAPQAGLVSFTVDSPLGHRAIVQKLEEQRIYLRTIADPDCIRACCHYITNEEEIEHLLSKLAEFSP
ncbi:aminotransferase class V-fold PLP-dependent enzyme [Synechocystis salina LEGE 06099]|uniref:aminotransferase class V-fold PLP-dependent enzyme n=1 Tax=Synechocystis salina TaxID=945780 RepID=UPI001881F2A9|nr:aminotransferase class V-fold PLP-dependent enzyme [Synechocystis salina]MBE9202498.1 aminotransferase class V-fold PLP-dependent enzyme [Synechocystis salina LEGE 06099]